MIGSDDNKNDENVNVTIHYNGDSWNNNKKNEEGFPRLYVCIDIRFGG